MFTRDSFDVPRYKSLDANQQTIVNLILQKRFKPTLRILIDSGKSDIIPIADHINQKRNDHSEKAAVSLMNSIVRDRFKKSIKQKG